MIFKLSKKQEEQLQIYKNALIKKNQTINLISRKESSFIDKIFKENINSSSLLEEVLFNSSLEVLDIGSGNGLPGLICGILYPETQFVLCERNRKKVECLKSFIYETGIKNTSVCEISAENLPKKSRIILSQATTNIEDLLQIFEQIMDADSSAYLFKNSFEKSLWESADFEAEVFKEYSSILNDSQKIILHLRRKK